MADQSLPTTTLGAIRWREAFPFTHLFRTFRVAIQPSKIVLGLVALLLLYFGGKVLDTLCPVRDRAVPSEVVAYENFVQHARPGDRFSDERDDIRRMVEAGYAEQLLRYKVVSNRDAADAAARNGDDLSELKDAIQRKRDQDIVQAGQTKESRLSDSRKVGGSARGDAEAAAQADYKNMVRAAYDEATAQYSAACAIRGEGLFVHFFNYELNQISNVVAGVAEGNFFGRPAAPGVPAVDVSGAGLPMDYLNPLGAVAAASAQPAAIAAAAAAQPAQRPGVVPAIEAFSTVGPVWLLTQHPLYFLLLGIYFLALWAVFGGAISRIAAVHIARDEKLSMRSAMQFSVGKFLSFFFAPIIPLLIVIVLGLLVTVGSLALGNIPVIGPILVGALFVLALIAGFVMALVLLGLVGGFNLMYPTIAVEGSDSFDAISRSFSYLYAKPWRLGFYSAVAIVYGALTYQFVRLFIYLMLALAHKFVGMGILIHAGNTAPLWVTMWPSPATAARLSYDVNYMALSGSQATGAALVSCWVYLVIAMLGAFAISFYFSANTIIYYLMRREVDATEMDDVYLEQVEDEFADEGSDVVEAPTATVTAETIVVSTAPPPPASDTQSSETPHS